MRKFTLLALSLLVAGIAEAGDITGRMAARIKRMNDPSRPRMAVMGGDMKTTKGFQLEQAGMPATPSMTPRRAEGEADLTQTGALSGSFYDNIYSAEGDVWFFTQSTVKEGFTIKSSEIVIYDSSHNEAGRINYVTPAGCRVNVVELYGRVTKNMFDRDEKTQEVLVYVHYLGDNYVNTDSTLIYRLNGERVAGYEGQIASVISVKQDELTTYQRAILQRSAMRNDETTGRSYLQFDILKPAGWGQTEPTIEHTFEVDYGLTIYSDGPCFTQCDVDGEPYYVLSYYRDDYVSGYDSETWEMIVRENNEYVLDVYDKNYNRVDSFAVPMNKPDDALYRMVAFNMFSSDKEMTKDYFTSGNGFNYVVTTYDYLTSTDDYRYSFDVYNGKGELLKNICDNVSSTWMQLSDIKGHDTQWMFMQEVGNTQQLKMVDLPGCTTAQIIPAEIDGETISTTLDRYPKGDSYQYVINMRYADADADNNAIARLGWYNKDLTLDRFVKFNLGPNGVNFKPLIYNESLDPYLFDTNDEHEYCYIATTLRGDGSSKTDNVIVIAREDGSTIREFRGDDNVGIYTGGLLNYGKANAEFYFVTGTFSGDERYDINYYSLPFNRFAAGGEGTADNPYLIATLGDMQQMKSFPDAAYRLTADIDMSEYPAKWVPVETFDGTFDGNGHALKNFSIGTTDYFSGIFGTLNSHSVIKDFVMLAPEMTVDDNCAYAGIIAGQATGTTISNVHIYDAAISGRNEATVGGLLGQAALYSSVTGSSFNGKMDLPEAESMGGIIGSTFTSSTVSASSASGEFTSRIQLGGIVGVTSTSADVLDCHTDATLKAKNNVGGIVGCNGSRAAILRCHVSGSIEATEASLWDGLAAGGIVGSIASDWNSATTKIITGCVVDADIMIPEGTANDGTANRIAGRTIINEDYQPGERKLTELGLGDNYALPTSTVGGQTVTSDDAESTNGATKEKADMTADFFAGLGYAYGTDAENPWKGSGIPVLWFENIARGLSFSRTEVAIAEGETAEVTVTVYGTDAGEISLSSSDKNIAAIEITDETDNTITFSIECKKTGTATITATAGDQTAECLVNGVPSGIESATVAASGMAFRINAGCIEAAGASRICVYSAGGQLAARAAGHSVSTAGMTKGVYIVVATDAGGRTLTGKVVLK